jgi:hypothetical protein
LGPKAHPASGGWSDDTQVSQQVSGRQGSFNEGLGLGARSAGFFGTVDDQFSDAILRSAARQGADVEAVELAFSYDFGSVRWGRSQVIAGLELVAPRQRLRDTAVRPQVFGQAFIRAILYGVTQQVGIVALALPAQERADVQLVVGNVVLHFLQHQLTCANIEVVIIQSHVSRFLYC